MSPRIAACGCFVMGMLFAAAGCSGSEAAAPVGPGNAEIGAPDAGDEVPAGEVSCVDDPRVDTYTANLPKLGTSAALRFTLVKSDPAPPAKGTNVFLVKIADANGAPMTGDLAVNLFMPDHGHGTTLEPVITFDPATHTYTVDPLYLFMPGVWRISLQAYPGSVDAGPPADSATYYFCVEG